MRFSQYLMIGQVYTQNAASTSIATPVTTVVCAAIAVTLPTGKYDRNLLINPGQNRWTVRPGHV
jgi:hypothetical protein